MNFTINDKVVFKKDQANVPAYFGLSATKAYTITSLDGDSVKLDDIPYKISTNLLELYGLQNLPKFQGSAILYYTSGQTFYISDFVGYECVYHCDGCLYIYVERSYWKDGMHFTQVVEIPWDNFEMIVHRDFSDNIEFLILESGKNEITSIYPLL